MNLCMDGWMAGMNEMNGWFLDRARAGPLAGEVGLGRQSPHQARPLLDRQNAAAGDPATLPTRARTREQMRARTAQLVRAQALPALRWDR